MSYIQIEIGGRLRGLKFNKMAHLILEQKIQPENYITGAYALLYGGLKANCYVKGEEADFSFEQVCDWVDGLSDEVLLDVQAAFQESESYKKGQAYLADLETAKKKETPNPKAMKTEEEMSLSSP